jgi:hypothetical protein
MICTDKEIVIIGTDLLNIGIINVDQLHSQCTYDATMRRLSATIVVVEKQ